MHMSRALKARVCVAPSPVHTCEPLSERLNVVQCYMLGVVP